MKQVVDLELVKVRGRLSQQGFELDLTEEARNFLIKKGTDTDFGARPMRRALENYIEDPLAEELLQGSFQGKNKILIDVFRNEEGKVKHLKFEGIYVEPEPVADEPQKVAATAGDSGGSKSK